MAMYRVQSPDGRMDGPIDEMEVQMWVRAGRIQPNTVLQVEPSGRQFTAGSWVYLQSAFASVGVTVQAKDAQPPPAGSSPGIPGGGYAAGLSVSSPHLNPYAHTLEHFSVGLVIFLNYLTLGLFTTIYFGLQHDRLPKNRIDDPSAGKAIGYLFIPFYNFYWVFFANLRLIDRINEQRVARGLPPSDLRGIMITNCIVMLIPYVGLLSFLVFAPIAYGMLQSSINELVAAGDARLGAPQPGTRAFA